MPAWEPVDSFQRDYDALTPEDKRRFRESVTRFVEDLKNGGRFRPDLGVRRIQGMEGCFEMTWAPNGRAIWMYGADGGRAGEPHVVWLAVGDASILP